MKEEKSNIGNFLRKHRKEKEMSLRSFSEMIGISFSHLSKIERGEHNPSKATISIIAEKSGLDKNDLFLMAGYAPAGNSGIDSLFPYLEDDIEEIKELLEDPDTELMFDDWKNMTKEQRKEALSMIKYILYKDRGED